MTGSGGNRRLATILFADVAGYSRMMRADEEQTLVDLRAHLAELVMPVVERFHGRIVKTVGDGVMVEFGSAVEAVRSAVELQRGMVERNAGMAESRRQTFRIGLHLGDIIAVDDDVFGDAVNVTARLQALAEPGSIVLSGNVHDQVRDKLSLPFRDMGRRALKNIDRPVQAYSLDGAASLRMRVSPKRRRVAVAGLALLALAAIVGGVFLVERPGIVKPVADGPPYVAILLFANQSGDAAQDYFADGLTEDITRALGRFKQLTVMAYGAVLPYRNKQLPPMQVGHALNARYLVGAACVATDRG